MRRFALLPLMLLAALPAVAQDAPDLLLRLTMVPEGPIWIGQRLTLTLTAMTPVRFAGPLNFPDIATEGKVLLLPEATTVPGVERIHGQSFVALQHTYVLFPAEAGELKFRPLRINTIVITSDGGSVEATATLPGKAVTVRVPNGVTDLTRLVVTPELSIADSVDRAPEGIRAGEAITRTVRMDAQDTAAMLLPPITWATPPGLAVYPDPPTLLDRTDRGQQRASRIERAVFVPQRAGLFELPGMRLTWLDPRNGQLHEATAKPLRIEALPSNGPIGGHSQSRLSWRRVVLLVTFAAPILILASVWRWMRRRARNQKHQAFATLAAACRAGQASTAVSALYRWCDEVLPEISREGGVGGVATLSGTPALIAHARALEDAVYGAGRTDTPWDGRPLYIAVRSARWRLALPRRGVGSERLPPLNPLVASRLPSPRVVLRHWVH